MRVCIGLVSFDMNYCRLIKPNPFSYIQAISFFKKMVLYKYSFLFTHSSLPKTVLFQTIPFRISSQCHCKKIVLFQKIQFSISTQFSSICRIDMTLSGDTTTGQSDQGSMAMKKHSAFFKALALLEPHHQIVFVIYPGYSLGKYYPSAEK